MTIDEKALRKAAEAATPGPWAYTTGCGASVAVGFVKVDEPGYVAIAKGGFILFEIEPSVYDRDGEQDEAELDERAFNDTRFIALANPQTVIALLDELAELRADREHLEDGARALARRIGNDHAPTPSDWAWMQQQHERERIEAERASKARIEEEET